MKNRMKKWIASMSLPERIYWLVVFLLVAAAVIAVVSLLHWGAPIEAADARYADRADAGGTCALGPRDGAAGRHSRRSQDGVPYVVVTPRNYRPGQAHPLLMVYAPAGFGAGLSERYAGLTQVATGAGFVVSFVGSLQLGPAAVDKLAGVPAEVIAGWCVDPERVYASGHSDGGSVAVALAALPKHQGMLRAIVASGVGWQAADFAGIKCPAPLPVAILHGADDTHFPGFGREVAAWWSACNGCTGQGRVGPDSCRTYEGCAAETVYCEPDRSHWRWAGDPQDVMSFFQRAAERTAGPAAR